MDGPRARAGECAIAMQMLIIVMVIVTAFVVTVTSASLSTAKDAAKRARRGATLSPGDGAAIRYQQAINSGLASDADGFQLTDLDLAKLTVPGETVVPNSSTPYPTVHPSVPAAARFTMQEQVSANQYASWQVYRVFPPDYTSGDGKVTVYFRAWTAGAPGASEVTSEPRVLRADLRQGAFADFQLLTDGPIPFQPNATVNGRVHSNGFLDGMQRPPAANPTSRAWAEGAISCTSSALVSTSRGTVDLPPTCQSRAATGEFVNLLRSQDSFDRIAADCASGTTRCFDNSPAAGQSYKVTLSPGQVVVEDPVTGNSIPIANTGTQPLAILLNGDARVEGTTGNRVTIAVRNSNPAGAAANIVLTGDTQRGGAPGDALGLIAQGHVILDMRPPATCPVSNVTAAIVAAGGGLTIPPGYTTEMYQSADTPRCANSLLITGSIASHRTPMLLWRWGGAWAGYTSRSYVWDPQLGRSQPPYFPTSGNWDIVGWKSANMDCYDAETAECA